MAAGRIVVASRMPARDLNGTPISGALLTLYENNTTTLTTIYANEALSVPLTNPVAADSGGNWPQMWAEAGTEESPTLYSLSLSDGSGVPLSQPAVFDDFRPSVDYDTATVALAETAAESAAAIYADFLAIEASGSDAAAIATRAMLDGSNFSGAQPEAFRANLGLGDSSVLDVGAVADTVAAGNDRRFRIYADISTSATAAENAAAIHAARDVVAARGGGTVVLPVATADYPCDPIYTKPGVYIEGESANYAWEGTTAKGVRLAQATAGTPCLNILSNLSLGVQRGCGYRGITVKGHASATVSATRIEAISPYAAFNVLMDVEVQGAPDGAYEGVISVHNEIYGSTIRLLASNCGGTVVKAAGYSNVYDLVVQGTGAGAGFQLDDSDSKFTYLGDGVVEIYGIGNEGRATVETIHTAPAVIWEGAIMVFGSRNTLYSPTVTNVQADRATASFRSSGGNIFISPVAKGDVYPQYPFFLFAGGGDVIVGGNVLCTFTLDAFVAADVLNATTFVGDTTSYYAPVGGVTTFGDEAVTLTSALSRKYAHFTAAITADRAVTLATTGARNGDTFRITRAAAATGAFNLNVGSGPLKALSAGQWCDVTFNGSAWFLSAAGSL